MSSEEEKYESFDDEATERKKADAKKSALKTPAKVWLWFMLAVQCFSLLSIFKNFDVIVVVFSVWMLTSTCLMLLKNRIGFYLLCAADIGSGIYYVFAYEIGLFMAIGTVLNILITWLCLKSSWKNMR